jgi:glyoxylase-like metal-dependent hydrolase (beta-lactamase superfamily II)
MIPYTKGLHQIADGMWAWLAPDGSWGWSNAGLIAGADASVLVDTLFDLNLTREMLAAMTVVTGQRPISDAVNTHANGDHCYGNSLLADSVRIHAAPDVGQAMHETPPESLAKLLKADLGPVMSPYMRHCFGAFDFDGITLRDPDVLVHGESVLEVGGRTVRLLDLGPAHTDGDVVIHVPDASVLFAGDLLFIGGAPIMWAGPVENWIAACDTMIALDPAVVVPGHGPVTDVAGIRNVRDYLTHIDAQARAGHKAGKPWRQTALEIDLGRFAGLGDSERVAANVYQIYRGIDPSVPEADAGEVFAAMAEWRATRQP